MPQQLQLLEVPKPLVGRFGEDFFRAAPRCPGVYIMTGPNERVLYIGQSKNLRVRLASYKNARPDRASRKTIRLVRQVHGIVWEICQDPESAQLRENELLRLHRPRFNKVNTYPRAYTFIWLRCDGTKLALGRTTEPTFASPSGAKDDDTDGDEAVARDLTGSGDARAIEVLQRAEGNFRLADGAIELYGAFKTRAVAGYASLLRLIWAAIHQPTSPHQFPSPLLSPRPPRLYQIEMGSAPARIKAPIPPETLLGAIRNFFAGTSDDLLSLLGDALPQDESLTTFQRAFQAHDLEILAEFYRFGTKRNYELRSKYGITGSLIAQEQIDDLLVREKTSRQG